MKQNGTEQRQRTGDSMFLLILAAFCAYFIKGLCGFANTLIFSSILSFGMYNIQISPVDLRLGFPSNVFLAWRNRRSLAGHIWIPLAVLVLLGNIPGIFLLKHANVVSVKIWFGVAVVGIGLEMLYRESKTQKQVTGAQQTKKNRPLLMLLGVLSGVLCGLYGIGALLAAYMSRVTNSVQAFQANLCAVFITENLFRIFVYGMTGILTVSALFQAMLLLPVMMLGLWLGVRSASYLPTVAVKKIMTIVLILTGVSLILHNLL